MSSIKRPLLAVSFVLGIALAAMLGFVSPSDAFANIAEGTHGTCPWVIDDEGTLTVSAGTLDASTEAPNAYSSYGKSRWIDHKDVIKKIVFEDGVLAPWNGYGALFSGLDGVVEIDIANLRHVPEGGEFLSGDGTEMFYGCSALERVIGLESLQSIYLNNAMNMFAGCSSIESIDAHDWKFGAAKWADSMFGGCESLVSVNASGWNTSNISDMSGMFANDVNLKTVEGINSWDTSGLKKAGSMFAGTGFDYLDLSNWDTSNVDDMRYMFGVMTADSIELNLAGFSTESLEGAGWDVFGGSSSRITAITLGDKWSFLEGDIARVTLNWPDSNDEYTGNWINTSVEGAVALTPDILANEYGTTQVPGRYVWEKRAIEPEPEPEPSVDPEPTPVVVEDQGSRDAVGSTQGNGNTPEQAAKDNTATPVKQAVSTVPASKTGDMSGVVVGLLVIAMIAASGLYLRRGNRR